MEENRYIAVLMRKKIISEGINIFFPDHIVSGMIEKDEDYFIDDFGEEYLFLNDVNGVFSLDDVVGYCILESDLLEKYEGLSKSEVLVEYFDDVRENTLIGFYHYQSEKIIFLNFNFNNILGYINEQTIDENSETIEFNLKDLIEELFGENLNFESNNLKDNSNESVEAIALEPSTLKELLKLSDHELKNRLTEIYKNYEKLSYHTEKNINDEIIDKIDKIYGNILNIDDLNKLQEITSGLEQLYLELVCSLDETYQFSNDTVKNEVENFLYKSIDIYHNISKSKDISLIKSTIESVKDRQKIHFYTLLEEEKKSKMEQKELEEVFLNESQTSRTEENGLVFNPKEMKAFLDKRIIGQEEAKKDVTSAIFMNSLAEESISKNTCLLVGPTGSGKTLIASSVAEFLDLPIVNIDTTQLTVPGYVGANIEDFLTRLIESANGDVEKAQKGIVILDEIDKKGSKSNGDVSGKGVLNTLLPFVQGTTYTVPYNHRKVSFDSSNLTIFMTGAFTDVAKGVSENSSYTDSKIGFGINRENSKKEDITYKKLKIEDFVEYGDFPVELVGRISNIVQLSGHTKESLKSILTDSNISVLKLEEEKLKKLNVEVKYNDDYLDRVAEKALSLKTGARSLKSTVEESIKEARWEAITASDQFKAIVLNKDCVDNNLKSILVYNDDNYTTVEDLRNKEAEKAVEKVKK